MGKMPSVSLGRCLSLSMALIAPVLYSGPLFAANPAVTKVLVQNFENGCRDSADGWPASKRQDFAETLAQNDMTIDGFCSCAAKSVFGTMSQSEVNRFLSDSSKYEGGVGDREPWKTRIDEGNRLCLAGVWPAED